MALEIKRAHIESFDIRKDDHGVVILFPKFSCKSEVTGEGGRPNTLNLTNIFEVCTSRSLQEIKNVPVRIMFYQNVLIAIGHHSNDNWCHLPSGGEMLSLDEIKELENEIKVDYLPF